MTIEPKVPPSLETRDWLDNSKIATYESCPRKYFLRYELNLAPETGLSPALIFGKAFHKAVETYFTLRSPNVEEALAVGYAILEACRPQAEEYDDWRLEPDSLLRAVNHFLTHAGSEIMNLSDKIYPELKLWFHDEPLGFTYVGRADLLIRTLSGTWSVIDLKTTSWAINQGWGSRLLVDTQLQGYAFLVESLYEIEVFGGGYAIISASRSRLKSGAWSPNLRLDSAFLPIALTPDHKERALHRFRTAAEGIAQDRSFSCRFSSCLQWNKVCSYHPICERTWSWRAPSQREELKELAVAIGFVEEVWDPFDDTK